MRNLILIAPPGGGKGTLSKQLVKEYGYVHISTGDLLREMAAIEDDFGMKLKEIMASGVLVEKEIVYEALEKKLNSIGDSAFILDGFPRNLEQANDYIKIANKLNKEEGIVVLLQIEKDDLEKRITGRFSCDSCGQIYNIYNPEFAPKVEGVCDKCNGKLSQRKDDNIESFAIRYQTYLDNTMPLIDFYKEKNILYEVDSTESSKAYETVKELIN